MRTMTAMRTMGRLGRRLPVTVVITAVLAALALVQPGPPAAESNGGVRVMPLGDEVFVAQIPPEADPTFEARIRAYNAALPDALRDKGPHVHLVDMHVALGTADLADGVHPTAAGYAKMGAVWYAALRSVSGALNPTGPPVGTPVRLVNTNSGRCLDVAGAGAAGGTRAVAWGCPRGGDQHGTP